MQTFIEYIVAFVRQLYNAIETAFHYNETSFSNYSAWLSKNVISGDLINIGFTWRELILFGTTWFVAILFIIFVFKLVSGVIRFFFIGK